MDLTQFTNGPTYNSSHTSHILEHWQHDVGLGVVNIDTLLKRHHSFFEPGIILVAKEGRTSLISPMPEIEWTRWDFRGNLGLSLKLWCTV